MEHVYGILLDEKFLYRSVHAAFVNTKWYEAWLERTLLLDPIIFDMWGPGVLSWRVMPRLPEEPEELFVPGPAFVTVDILTRHICSVSLCVFLCRWSETSTFGLCRAADVRRSGPGPGGRTHEDYHKTTFHHISFYFLKLLGTG